MAKEAERKHIEIKKLDVLSVGKVFALLGAFAGFLFGIIISCFLYKISTMPNVQQLTGLTQVTTTQLIGLPFWYLLIAGIIWGLVAMVFALVYNLIAKSGGLKLAVK